MFVVNSQPTSPGNVFHRDRVTAGQNEKIMFHIESLCRTKCINLSVRLLENKTTDRNVLSRRDHPMLTKFFKNSYNYNILN